MLASLKYIHKILKNKKPLALLNLFLKKNAQNTDTKIRLKHIPKTKKLLGHIICKASNMYNTLPAEIQTLPVKKFSKQIEIHMNLHNVWDTHDPSDLDL